MKIQQLILITVMAVAFAFGGCKKSGVDTSGLEKSFKSAEPATQSSADKVVSAIKAGDYASATAELKTLAEKAKLTSGQQQAIKDVTAQLQQMVAGAVKKAGDKANEAGGDLQKSLKK